MHWAQADINSSGLSQEKIVPILYRPFDERFTYFTGQSSGFICRPRPEVMRHMQKSGNKGLHLCRQVISANWQHVFATKYTTDDCYVSNRTRERGYTLPLYLYPTEGSRQQRSLLDVSPWAPDEAHGGRTPNLNPDFVADMAQKLGLTFIPSGSSDLRTTFGPEDIFNYIYAIFHNPTYRARYAEFLKIDFPRVPLTPDVALFRHLCALGKALVGLHLLESPEVRKFITRYPIAGDNRVERGYPRYEPPEANHPGLVHINKSQHFEGVTLDVWELQIGGYQPAQKWLKDRIGRQLSYDDLTHYQQIVAALQRTAELMEEIDRVIPEWPMQLVTMFE